MVVIKTYLDNLHTQSLFRQACLAMIMVRAAKCAYETGTWVNG